jgi:hypothetical protein
MRDACRKLWPRRRDQLHALLRSQVKGFREQSNGLEPWSGALAAFEIADASRTQPGELGQVLLAQSCLQPVPAKHIRELDCLNV